MPLAVSWLQHYGSLQSGVAQELNLIQLSAICCWGQKDKVIDLDVRCFVPLGLQSCTNIAIKAAKQRAAGYSESSINVI